MRVVLAVVLLLCAAAAQAHRLSWRSEDIDKKAAEKVLFMLYSRENLNDAETLVAADLPRTSFKNFNPNRPTKVFVHGWQGKIMRTEMLKDAVLSKLDMNVILLNWHGVDTLVYPVAAARVRVVAVQLARVLQHLVDHQGLRPADLHIVGHSLGAHIAGLTALHLRDDTTIGRITGLDPAGPLFQDGRENRLDKSHAAFVDVIHTCVNLFGYRDAIGHVDFYPNGGTAFQPGCVVKDLTTGKCSHNLAYFLFNESILLNGTLMAYPGIETAKDKPCGEMNTAEEPVVMGLHAPSSARGVYCLPTRTEAPYGYGKDVPAMTVRLPSRMEAAIMKYVFHKLS